MILHKRLNYIVPDKTETGLTVLYHDIDGEIMCAECCNDKKVVPFNVLVVADDEEWECEYCHKYYPAREADFTYHVTSDHDRFYLTIRCSVCEKDLYAWQDEDALQYIEDFLPSNPSKWHQSLWEFMSDNNLLHYH